MARILITSGPTRQYVDPVRYLTNASSGRMGKALTEAALAEGHQVVVVSGPVEVVFPENAQVEHVTTTDQMLAACLRHFSSCDGVIGVAAPCDYRPERVVDHKLAKTGQPLNLRLIETPDILATLGARKRRTQWAVGFALETHEHRSRALQKLAKKNCDLIIVNHASAMNSVDTEVEILDADGQVILHAAGSKTDVAQHILGTIQTRLITNRTAD